MTLKTLKIADRTYELDIRNLKIKALKALQRFQQTEDFDELMSLIGIILNEKDAEFILEELTIGHILEIKEWTISTQKDLK